VKQEEKGTEIASLVSVRKRTYITRKKRKRVGTTRKCEKNYREGGFRNGLWQQRENRKPTAQVAIQETREVTSPSREEGHDDWNLQGRNVNKPDYSVHSGKSAQEGRGNTTKSALQGKKRKLANEEE